MSDTTDNTDYPHAARPLLESERGPVKHGHYDGASDRLFAWCRECDKAIVMDIETEPRVWRHVHG